MCAAASPIIDIHPTPPQIPRGKLLENYVRYRHCDWLKEMDTKKGYKGREEEERRVWKFAVGSALALIHPLT